MPKLKTGPRVKRKSGGVPVKAEAVDRLAAEIADAKAVIVTDYRGLTVGQLQVLRRRLRPRGVAYRVVKNSLFARAAERVGRGGLRSLLSGPTAVAIAGAPGAVRPADEMELARGLVDETRTLKALRIVGALVAGRAMSADDVIALAKLPPRSQLQAQIVWSLQAPLGQLTGLMQVPLGNLVRVLNARGAQTS